MSTIGGLGEFGLIDAITTRFPQAGAVLVGPGDDAAVLRAGDGRVVATTDLLAEGQHFLRAWSSGYDVGRKAAAQNLADVAAMGAVPTALLVGLAAPPDLETAWALDLADGLRDESAPLGASVVGGDVTRAGVITVAVTALGDLQGRRPVRRGGAQVGDIVAVAGRLGWS
ncbi:MAG: thiamine-phosphate kinase, partial [Carbonactinosporaceae bacterium]